MKRNIFIIFIILLAIATSYFYIQKNNNTPEPSTRVNCENLSREKCFHTYGCENKDKTDSTFGDIMHLGCKSVPEDIIQQMEKDKKLCESSGGIFKKPSIGNKYFLGREGCLCSTDKNDPYYGHRFFAHDEGCIIDKEYCIAKGGIWHDTRRMYDIDKQLNKSDCEKIGGEYLNYVNVAEYCKVFSENGRLEDVNNCEMPNVGYIYLDQLLNNY